MDSASASAPPAACWEEVDVKEIENLLTENTERKVYKSFKPDQDVLSNYLDISIAESEKRLNGPLALKAFYTVYLIETKVNSDKIWKAELSSTGSVWRRYTEFEQLRIQLENNHPEAIIPPLPEKKPSYTRQIQSSDNIDPVFIDRRRVGLESFLSRIASHPILCQDPIFVKFLQCERDWSELNTSAEGGKYVHQAEFKIKSMSVAMRLKKPDDRMEAVKLYGHELEACLGNFLRNRVQLADRLYAIHKLHGNYGRVFSEWSGLEKTLGDGLQKAGHYMDCYAASIDAHLEEEDIVADQLKEYMNFGGSVQELCSRHQMAQFEVEKAESHLAALKNMKERRGQDVLTKLWGKVTGATESYSEREAKMQSIEKSIEEAQMELAAASEKLSQLTEKATKEVERFHVQKNQDLKESLTNYVMLQLKLSKMGLQTWKHVKEALEAMP